jgi:4-aminobutyrate aminotransferase / (S)-3-amino-2-methylpropionate transaminase / 5-aminovalerate transaminase
MGGSDMTKNADIFARRMAAIPRGVSNATQVIAARAENAEIWDVEGKRYIDFVGGIAVLNTGHRHPKVIKAVEEQLKHYTHTAFQVTAYEPYIRLAERLNALAPIEGPVKTIFFSTGAEATENAIKIARVATGRSAVIAFTGAFHGRTLLASAMTGKVVPYKKGFGPMPPEIYHVPFPIEPYGISVEASLQAIDKLFKATLEPERVAAIIIEPVQGEGGFHPAPVELLVKLRALCDQHRILLIADEVQSGFARTGRMFGIEHSGVKPDLITVAKSLAGGFPLSGVIGKAMIMDAADPGGLGGTYAGSPIACAAGLAVLDVIEEESLLSRADHIGDLIRKRLKPFQERNDLMPIAAIRGPGAMIGFDIVKEHGGHEPDPDSTKKLIATALKNGLMLLSCGTFGNTIRILVPLTASDDLIEEGMNKLEQSLSIL